ncbi:hypothetical protein KY092_05270 [Natronomonas gomsonensis]|uniref:hypothetical protein n=1 Tax=Natronomonas gomsonensis TaxID=1046043 RepID=UPI0020CA6327|nr:hypothetical protein [Natronomonas gomsonensis]MCY4729967.1 hypothetical protein [Natronomonas gomsonensis]
MFRTLKRLLGTNERKAVETVETAMDAAMVEASSGGETTFKSYEEQKRIAEKKKGKQHRQQEQQYNEHFDGCPSCSKHGLTIQWIILSENKKAKSIECQYCNTMFREKVVNGELELQAVDSIHDVRPVKSAEQYERRKHEKLGNL